MSKEKNLYFQTVRAVSIIFVIIIIHLPNGLSFEKDSFYYNFYMAERCFIGIAVPVFFVMSGYFTNYRKEKIFDKRLVIPFLVWSLIYGIWNDGIGILSLKGVFKTIFGLNAPHLYFMFVLIQIRLLLPVIERYKNHKFMPCAVAAVTVFWYGWYYASGVFGSVDFVLPVGMTSFFPAWIIYWYIGFLLKERDIFKDISRNMFLAGAIFFLILTIAEGYWIDICNINISPVSQMKISNMLYCICAAGFIFKSEKRTKKSLITAIGDYSYGIYFIHFIFIYIILDYFEYISRIPLPVLHIAGAAAVLGISMTVIFLVRRIFGKKSAGVFLGF